MCVICVVFVQAAHRVRLLSSWEAHPESVVRLYQMLWTWKQELKGRWVHAAARVRAALSRCCTVFLLIKAHR